MDDEEIAKNLADYYLDNQEEITKLGTEEVLNKVFGQRGSQLVVK